MSKEKDKKKTENIEDNTEKKTVLSPSDLEWTDHVLALLSDDEKIKGNPTTDGLRRIFEKALNCRLIQSTSTVVQSPDPSNEKRATVVHSVTYILNTDGQNPPELNTVSIDGSADVYWGNCDKIYRNHPVAVAETRAEGRALRRALKLRKVVAAEEMAESIEDHPDERSVSKISHNQINFIDVMAQRLNINVTSLMKELAISVDNVYNISHDEAVGVIHKLSSLQQSVDSIPTTLTGYQPSWK